LYSRRTLQVPDRTGGQTDGVQRSMRPPPGGYIDTIVIMPYVGSTLAGVWRYCTLEKLTKTLKLDGSA